MRLLLLLFTLLCMVMPGVAQNISIGAGGNASHLEGSKLDLMDELGYYVQLSKSGKLTDIMGYGGDIQFVQHHNKVDGLDFNAHGVNLSFYYKVYPMKQGLHLLAGFQVGVITMAKLEEINLRGYSKESVSWLFGAGYDIDRYTITSRYNHYFEDLKIFDRMIQLGVSYHLK